MMQPVTPDHAVQQVQNPKAAENCSLVHLPDTARFLQLYDDALDFCVDGLLCLWADLAILPRHTSQILELLPLTV